MKFLLLAVTIAVAFCTAGDLSGLTLGSEFVNSTGKRAASWCSIKLTATHLTTAPSAAVSEFQNLWLVNSAVAGTWVVNQTVIYVNLAATVLAGAITTTVATGSIYFAAKAHTLTIATDIPADVLTASAFTAHSASMSTAGYAVSVNITWAQLEQLNSTKLSEKAHAHYKYEQTTNT
jgi:hypothetical protein